MRLLFTGGGGAGNEAIARLWGKRYELHFADTDTDAISSSIARERRHALRWANDPAFAEQTAALCRTLGIDLIIPGVDEELPRIPEILSLCPHLRALLPQPHVVEVSLDKLASMRQLTSAGIPVPETVPAAESEQIGFPCLVKPRSGRGSRGVAVLRSREQLGAYLTLADSPPSAYIAQRLLTGQEYTVQMIADATGKLHAVVPVLVKTKRGITLRAVTHWDSAVIDACQRIHAVLGARGCYNVQVMRTASGDVLPFEINPRVSTTFCMSLAVGIDPVAIFDGVAPNPSFSQRTVELRREWLNGITIQSENDA